MSKRTTKKTKSKAKKANKKVPPRVVGSGPVPPAVLAARAKILAEHGGGGTCTRCDGEGYLEDNESWIIAEGKKGVGKVCFRCRGDGIEPGDRLPDPLLVRANVIKRLAPIVERGEVLVIAKLAHQFMSGPFWPCLEDAFHRAQVAARARRPVKPGSTAVSAPKASQGGAQRVREVSASEHLSRGLNAHFAGVLEKHHPDASPEEFAEAMGGHATFGGDVVFYEDEEF